MSDPALRTVSAPVSRALAVIEAIAGFTADGRRLRDVADVVRQSAPTTLRDLQTLESLGIAQRIPGREDCWRLTPRLVRIAIAHQHELARLQQKLDELERNYGAR